MAELKINVPADGTVGLDDMCRAVDHVRAGKGPAHVYFRTYIAADRFFAKACKFPEFKVSWGPDVPASLGSYTIILQLSK